MELSRTISLPRKLKPESRTYLTTYDSHVALLYNDHELTCFTDELINYESHTFVGPFDFIEESRGQLLFISEKRNCLLVRNMPVMIPSFPKNVVSLIRVYAEESSFVDADSPILWAHFLPFPLADWVVYATATTCHLRFWCFVDEECEHLQLHLPLQCYDCVVSADEDTKATSLLFLCDAGNKGCLIRYTLEFSQELKLFYWPLDPSKSSQRRYHDVLNCTSSASNHNAYVIRNDYKLQLLAGEQVILLANLSKFIGEKCLQDMLVVEHDDHIQLFLLLEPENLMSSLQLVVCYIKRKAKKKIYTRTQPFLKTLI